MFNSCGRILAPPLIKSINNLLPWRKKTCQITTSSPEPFPRLEKKTVGTRLVKSGEYNINYVLLCSCEFEFRDILIQGLQVNIAHEIDSMQLSRMNAGRKNSSLTPKKSAKTASSDACCLCGINLKISVGDFPE